jgi:soluble cytochrome b562
MKIFFPCASVLLLAVTIFAAHADTVLGDSMKKMEDACKQLGPDLKITDATKHNKDLDLQSIAAIKAECLKAREQSPKKAKALPPDQQQTMTASFQKDMDTFIQHVDQVTQEIQDEKWDAARDDFKKLMLEQRDDHKVYRIKK